MILRIRSHRMSLPTIYKVAEYYISKNVLSGSLILTYYLLVSAYMVCTSNRLSNKPLNDNNFIIIILSCGNVNGMYHSR